MEKQFQHLTEVQCNELLKLSQNPKSFLMKHLAPGNISSRLRIKIGRRADMFNITFSTKVTLGNVQKRRLKV